MGICFWNLFGIQFWIFVDFDWDDLFDFFLDYLFQNGFETLFGCAYFSKVLTPSKNDAIDANT